MKLLFHTFGDIQDINSLPDHGTADIWSVDINSSTEDIINGMQYLDDKELSRYSRYLREEDRLRFAGGRIFTKLAAAAYLRKKAVDISIYAEKNAKPIIKDAKGLSYNISHSGNMILLAFSADTDIGIDIEKIDTDIDAVQLSTVLHPHEKEAVVKYGVNEFYKIWTNKEAYVKAVGKGFSIPAESFFVKENGTVSNANGYIVSRIDRYQGYSAAFCYKYK
jgi:4'-phosphopantetheinyl transferase